MIYLIANKTENFCKIGFSNNPEARLMQLQTGNPYPLELLKVIEGDITKEREIHNLFKHLSIHGEWFNYTLEIKTYFKVNDDYGKLYTENINLLAGCSGKEIGLFLACIGNLQWKTNKVLSDRKTLARVCDSTLNTINTMFSKLTKRGILIKDKNGEFYVNTNLFFYG